MEKIQLTVLSCSRCEHRWIPRNPKPPKVCPRCKRTDWNGKSKK